MKKLKHVKLFENFNSNDFKQLLGKSIKRIEWMNDATDYEDGIMIINTDDGMYELSGVTGGEFYVPQIETYGSISAPERRYMHLDEYDCRLVDFEDINRNYPGHKITTVESLNDIKDPLHMTSAIKTARQLEGLHLKIANQEALDNGGFVTLVIYGDDIQIKKTR
jgi:hypothetical protein